MRDSFKQRISKIDRSETGKEDEESAMVGVIVSLVIDKLIQSRFRRKKNNRCQVQNGRRDQDEYEEQKRPWLLITPAIENPPCHHQIEKKIRYPDGMHPIKPATRARLQHFADAGEDPCHAQGQDNRNEDGEVTEWIHGMGLDR